MGRPGSRSPVGAGKVEVRPRLTTDLGELVEVAARVRELDGYPAYLPGDDLRRFVTCPGSLGAWVAEAEGRVVGHVALNPGSHTEAMEVVRDAGIIGELGVVARLLVEPSVRGCGLGTRLLGQAQAEAIGQDRTPVLDVVASAVAAISLYRASGWYELGRCEFVMPDQAPIEEIVFAAPLVGSADSGGRLSFGEGKDNRSCPSPPASQLEPKTRAMSARTRVKR